MDTFTIALPYVFGKQLICGIETSNLSPGWIFDVQLLMGFAVSGVSN